MSFTLGGYLRSYFTVNLNSGEELSTVQDISDILMPTFYHEYFHFIQDLTTPYGLHSAWARLNQLQQVIHAIQKEDKIFNIPYNGGAIDHVKRQIELIGALHSDINIVTDNPDALNYEKITLEFRPQMCAFEHHPQTRFVKLHYRTDLGEPCCFWFGGGAVMESMTEIIQEKFFGDTGTPRFPYKIAKEYASTVNFDLFSSNGLSFALCDLALLSNNPGLTFNSIAVNVGNRFRSLPTIYDFYDAGLKYLKEQGYSLERTVYQYRDNVIANISQLFGHESFKNEREWLIHIIEAGSKLRVNCPLFMVDLYEQDLALSPSFRELMSLLGTPEIRNFNHDRYFRPPFDLLDNKDNIFPFHLAALYQLNTDLLRGTKRCSLIEYCRMQDNIPHNALCYGAHWEKVSEQAVCPLTALYKGFGLDTKLK